MLLKIIQNIHKKKSLEEYQRFLTYTSLVSAGITCLFVLLSFTMGTKGFAFGILIGGAMGCLIVTIYYGILSRNPKKVKKLYIEAYDERNKLVLYAAAVATLVWLFVVLGILTVLYAFFNLAIGYPILMVILLYSLLLGFFTFKQIFTKTL